MSQRLTSTDNTPRCKQCCEPLVHFRVTASGARYFILPTCSVSYQGLTLVHRIQCAKCQKTNEITDYSLLQCPLSGVPLVKN